MPVLLALPIVWHVAPERASMSAGFLKCTVLYSLGCIRLDRRRTTAQLQQTRSHFEDVF